MTYEWPTPPSPDAAATPDDAVTPGLVSNDGMAATLGEGDPPLSGEALLAVVLAALIVLAIGLDAWLLSKGKHAICSRWLAKGKADCAGGDGFRQWFPYVAKNGLILIVAELAIIPLAVYGAGRLLGSRLR